MVCTLPACRDKRSQMGLFQAGERREGEGEGERGAICTRVHDGAYCRDCTELRNFLRPTRRRCIADESNRRTLPFYVALYETREGGTESSLFQLRSITGPSYARAVHFPSRREIASLHIYFPPFFLREREREREVNEPLTGMSDCVDESG